jgi:hypothetical protein
MTASRAVYTALFGGYERLLEQPVAASSDVEFICFTDDPGLTSTTWQVHVVEPHLPGDMVRSARVLKIRGHEALDAFHETLWIDNSVLLKRDPAELLDEWLSDGDLAMPAHSFRATVAAEFDAVLATGRDDRERVDEQFEVYSVHHPERLEGAVLWTAILARRRSPAVSRAMERWLDHVLRYSRRDQLSIGYVLEETGVVPTVIDLENRVSTWHEWPMAEGRRSAADVPARWPIEGEHERMARLRGQVDELILELSRSVVERERVIESLEGSVRELISSTSWRATAPLRKSSQFAGALLRRMRRTGGRG